MVKHIEKNPNFITNACQIIASTALVKSVKKKSTERQLTIKNLSHFRAL